MLSSNKQTLGIGNGQTNKMNSLALNKYKSILKKWFIVSDGFFHLQMILKLLKKNNCLKIEY